MNTRLDDEKVAAGRPLNDEEPIEYIITGLDEEFTPLVSAICARAEPISLSEFYSQLLSFETHVGLLQDGQSRSINASTRGGFHGRGNMRGCGTSTGGRDFSTGRGGPGRGRGGGRGGYGYHNAQKYSNNNESIICQVCGKKNHTSTECWHRFDESYVPEQKTVAHAATGSYNIDPNWYADSGATYHITGELENLAIRNKYQGGDQIHMASGVGMDISHIGHNTVYTPHRPIYLNNILYVPRTRKNLVSVHCLTSDNSISIEFHPLFFFIKDLKTKNILLKGRCVGGLYPLPIDAIKEVCSAARSSIKTWHNRLGHASNRVIKQVVRDNNISCSQESVSQLVYDACQ
jgi:hypothetical protein